MIIKKNKGGNTLEKLYQQQKRNEMRDGIKKYVLVLFLFLGVIGGFKALFTNSSSLSNETNDKYAMITNFTENYVTRYFSSNTKNISAIKKLTADNVELPKNIDSDKELLISNVQILNIKFIEIDIVEVEFTFEVNQLDKKSTINIKIIDNQFFVMNALLIEDFESDVTFTKKVDRQIGESVDSSTAKNIIISYFTALNKDAVNNTNEAMIFNTHQIKVSKDTLFDVDSLDVKNCIVLSNNTTECEMQIKQNIFDSYSINKMYIVILNTNNNKIIEIRGE